MIRHKLLLSFVLSFVFPIVLLSAHSYADPLDNWHWRNPTPQGNPLNAVTCADGTFVAVGRAGIVVTSKDGVTWTRRVSGITNHLSAVAYGGGRFVAVGEGGAVLTSQDGEVWTSQVSGTTSFLRSVAYGNNTFVLLGGYDEILTSPDGIAWKESPRLQDAYYLSDVAFGNGMFVGIGYSITSDSPAILTSPDGVNWNQVEPVRGAIFNGANVEDIAFGNGTFVVTGIIDDTGFFNDQSLTFTSSDGLHWTGQRLEPSHYFTDITYGNGVFIASTYSSVFLSPDGIDWTYGDENITNVNVDEYGYEYITGVAAGNGLFVAIGEYRGNIYTSSDAKSWTERSSGSHDSFEKVNFWNGTFVAEGYRSVFASPDGINWTMASDTSSYVQGMTYGNGLFVAVGRNGTILTSPDLVNWTSRDSKVTHDFSGVVYGNGVFLAMSIGNPMLTSPDGMNWTTRYWPYIDRAVYGNGVFVGLEIDDQRWLQARILTSFNGIDWMVSSTVADGYPPWPSEIAFGNDMFVILSGHGSLIQTSTDGINWKSLSFDYPYRLSGLSYGNNTFVVAGMNAIYNCDYGWCMDGPGVILTSSDGVNWTKRAVATDQALSGVAYGNGTFLAVGENGTILQSDLVADDCAASLSDDLVLKVPKIIFEGKALSAELQYEPSGQAMLRVTKVESLSQPVDFESCPFSMLTAEGSTFKLRVPVIYYSGASYWADLEYVPTGDGQIWFKVIGADRN